MWSISAIISGRENQSAPRKTIRITLSTKNLAWIFLGTKAMLSGDNPAPLGHPVFISTNGNKKKGTVHIITNNQTFVSKCISKTE
jgi:hypothetical protein